MEKLNEFVSYLRGAVANKLSHLSAEAVGWLAIVLIHCATIPSVFSLIIGMSDRLPSLDVVMFMWTGLLLLFIRSLINKDTLNIITIGFGFFIHAFLLALVVFK